MMQGVAATEYRRIGQARRTSHRCATKGRLMMTLRRVCTASLVALAILCAGAARHTAFSEENAPDTAKPPDAAKPPDTAKLPDTAKPLNADCPRSTFRVVVDVGHTVKVPGAMSARGVTEYDFNLHLAEDIKKALVDAGFERTTLLIVAASPPSGLVERAVRANSMPADLFISIHHDSVPDHLLQSWDYEGKQNRYNDNYPGYALFISNDNADRAGSLLFGKLLGKALEARGLQYTPHYTLPLMGNRRRILVDAEAGVYRYDQLVVLRATHMAALLLEAGSIVNRPEELELATPERRALTSAAVESAVEDFCAAHSHSHPVALIKRPAAPRVAQPARAVPAPFARQ
jgi:N-acetylmuramoyl-L-alanine amidase